jgi:CTP synthase
MQVALIDFARNVANMADAHSTEFNADTKHPVVGLITEWVDSEGNVEERTEKSDLGGTMRLGSQLCHLQEGSKARELYAQASIHERHRHRYEVNNNLLPKLVKAGLKVSGLSADKKLVEIIEIPNHPWFVAAQFHPEFTSTPRDGHPLFEGFVKAAGIYHRGESDK